MVRDEEMEAGGDVEWPEEVWQGITIVQHLSCHQELLSLLEHADVIRVTGSLGRCC